MGVSLGNRLINLVKLSVGTESVDSLERWQMSVSAQGSDGLPRHITRMWPKRAAEVLAGGSIYWVIKGAIQARQRIVRLDEVNGSDGIRRCAIVLDPCLIRTVPSLKRPFQGWRYLDPANSPADLNRSGSRDDTIPPRLSAALAEIGVR